MSDDQTVGRINFLSNEPLQVSLGGTPFNKAHLDARAAEIKRLETALTEARAEIERLREAAKGQNAVVNTVWNTFVDAPEPGRKFVALYNDGSGARMFYAFDGGVIDCDGDELYGFDLAEQSYGLWAYLPDNLEFWCETRAEDPMTLKVIR